MLETLDKCPLCNNEKFEKVLKGKDFVVSQETFEIVSCKRCNLKFTNPRPTENSIGNYYQSEEYISHQDNSKGLINKTYYIVKKIALKKKLQLINQIQTRGKILDIGCGTGSFLNTCKSDNWEISGIEPDNKASEIARIKLDTEIFSDIFTYKTEKKINLITMWHVLEHVHQLNQTLEKINLILESKGKLVIAVPNAESLDAQIYKEFWAAYDLPRHLYHFTKESLIQLMKKHGFNLIKIEPMKFDAYYITLLSNKYKEKKMNYFKAVMKGFQSNQWAKKNYNNYSSLTYIFSK